jgi:hypothetical protein
LSKYWGADKTCIFSYDYGDGWQCDIKLIQVIDDYAFLHPTVLKSEGQWPPEDVGGEGGYEDLLEAIKNSTKKNAELLEWLKSVYYEKQSIEKMNKKLKKIL